MQPLKMGPAAWLAISMPMPPLHVTRQELNTTSLASSIIMQHRRILQSLLAAFTHCSVSSSPEVNNSMEMLCSWNLPQVTCRRGEPCRSTDEAIMAVAG